jgi:hypothetical protein
MAIPIFAGAALIARYGPRIYQAGKRIRTARKAAAAGSLIMTSQKQSASDESKKKKAAKEKAAKEKAEDQKIDEYIWIAKHGTPLQKKAARKERHDKMMKEGTYKKREQFLRDEDPKKAAKDWQKWKIKEGKTGMFSNVGRKRLIEKGFRPGYRKYL